MIVHDTGLPLSIADDDRESCVGVALETASAMGVNYHHRTLLKPLCLEKRTQF
jgi:hypothetical protein